MISKTDNSIDIIKKSDLCVPRKKQSDFTLCFSSSFLFNVVIIRHFNTVNTLNMVELRYSQT